MEAWVYKGAGTLIFAGAARRVGPDSMLILCVSVSFCEIISRPLIARKLTR